MDSAERTVVWIAGICIGGITLMMAAATIGFDTETDRISACVQSEHMQYVDGDCIPVNQYKH